MILELYNYHDRETHILKVKCSQSGRDSNHSQTFLGTRGQEYLRLGALAFSGCSLPHVDPTFGSKGKRPSSHSSEPSDQNHQTPEASSPNAHSLQSPRHGDVALLSWSPLGISCWVLSLTFESFCSTAF